MLGSTGLTGALTSIVVRSGFGSGIWVSVVAEDRALFEQKVGPLRTFKAGHSALRARDLQSSFADCSHTSDKIGLLVYLGVNDSSVVFLAALETSETSDSAGGLLIRTRLIDKFDRLSFGSEEHYSSVPLSRLASSGRFREMLSMNETLHAQLAEQLLRVGALCSGPQNPLWILKAAMFSAILTTDLDGSGRKISNYPGPLKAGSDKDELGCSPRLLALLWVAEKLGYLRPYRTLASTTTREGSGLLEWLETSTAKSTEAWARNLRALRKQEFSGPSLELPSLLGVTQGVALPEDFLHHIGEVFTDVYNSICEWLADSKNLEFDKALALANVFTTVDSKPNLELSWVYLGFAAPCDPQLCLAKIMAPRRKFLDKALWTKHFGEQFAIISHLELLCGPGTSSSEASVPLPVGRLA